MATPALYNRGSEALGEGGGSTFTESQKPSCRRSICYLEAGSPSLLEVCDTHVIVPKMAGPIRQPIDIPALQRYIEQNVPEIKTPLEVKQVDDTL